MIQVLNSGRMLHQIFFFEYMLNLLKNKNTHCLHQVLQNSYEEKDLKNQPHCLVFY